MLNFGGVFFLEHLLPKQIPYHRNLPPKKPAFLFFEDFFQAKLRQHFSKPVQLMLQGPKLAGGFNPLEKYAGQIGNLPQIGVKIKQNETTT